MSANISFIKRLQWFLGLYEFTPEENSIVFPDEPTLSSDTQMMIATEAALVAAVQMVIFQKEAWNDLVDDLEDRGVTVEISEEAKIEYAGIMLRIQAAFTVARENLNFTDEMMKGLVE